MGFQVVEAKGSPYEIGAAIGESLRERIRDYHGLIEERLLQKQIDKEKLKYFLLNTAHLISLNLPDTFRGIQGISQGAGLPQQEIMKVFDEEYTLGHTQEHCTSFGMVAQEGILLAHNEDWNTGLEELLFVLRAQPTNKPSFVSLSYVGTLGGTSISVNNEGVAFSDNTILYNVSRLGIPKSALLHSLLESTSGSNLIKRANIPYRGTPNHTLAVDKYGGIYSVEIGLENIGVRTSPTYLAHTNHCLTSLVAAEDKKDNGNSSSRARLNRVDDIIENTPAPNWNEELAWRALTDHANNTDGICRHAPRSSYEKVQTIASAVANPMLCSLKVRYGNGCTGAQEEYRVAIKS